MDFSTAFQKVEESVVQVLAMDVKRKILSSGSGTIISPGNLVLTCAHCIIPETSTVVRFSGQKTTQTGNVIFIDQQVDVALVQFQSEIGPPAPLRTSSSVLVGHEVFVVGFPNNISQITALSGNVAGFEPVQKLCLMQARPLSFSMVL